MKLETFFEKFDQFADAPDAVEKMRELVLSFAVTGRLSERKASDAPVGDLIGALSVAKKQRLNKGRRPAIAEGAAQVEAERPVVVPDHWAWVPLNEIGGLSGGMTPSKAKAVFWDGDVNWFSSKDIKPDELTESELKITREGVKATGLQLFSPDCLVMVTRSGILKHTFPVSILRVEGTVNQDLKVLSPFVGGLERYLQIMLRGLNGFIITSLVKTGMTVQSLKFDEFSLQPFPLPPLAEQKRIVAKVDELMALCDRLEAQQQERETRHAALARASLARFAGSPQPSTLTLLFHPSYSIPPADLRKSILTLAVQGKLVPQDPNDEPAEELLGRIDSSRNVLLEAGIVPKQKPLADIGEAECQHSIPETWQWIRLQRAAEIIDPNPSHRMPRYCASGVPFISTENFVGREEIDFSIGKQVDDAQLEEQKQGFTIRPGSFALSRIGTIGKTRMLPLERNYCMSHALVVIAPYSEDIDSKFLRMVVSSDAVQGQASHGAKSIGVPDLGMGKIRSFVVPLPPLAEQRRIVAKVEQLMALVDALETQLAASRATAANLLSALVAELTGSPSNGKVSAPSASGTGRRGRPRKTP